MMLEIVVQVLLIVSSAVWVAGWLLALWGEMARKEWAEAAGAVLAVVGTISAVVLAVIIFVAFLL